MYRIKGRMASIIARRRLVVPTNRLSSPLAVAAIGVGLFFFITAVLSSTVSSRSVGYDHRALLIDGERRFLISGSIHYPRSTPQMWPGLLTLAKEGGLDVIDTYVFWNVHEPIKGKYNFEDRYDLIGFLQAVQNAGLFVNLRIGPFISAEWNFGGFPAWLREIPGIEFRTDNKPFEAEMERFVRFIVNMLQENTLFYTQGGPIIISQIENEYRHVAKWYGDGGTKYTDWAATMALSLNTTVPWIMCSQAEAPADIIITCNGIYCDDFKPTDYNKPMMWTENYPGWFHYWGQPLMHRPVEDTAFAVARFFQAGGSYMNYYMYHGGTNFGRTSAKDITTSYDYHAPIDEYGRVRQPDWDHLKDLHAAIKLCAPAMAAVDDEPRQWNPDLQQEIHVYNASKADGSSLCAAFLSNMDFENATIEFYGQTYHVPAWSVSILPDCKTDIFNSAKVSAQTSINRMVDILIDEQKLPTTKKAQATHDQGMVENTIGGALQWEWYKDPVGVWGEPLVASEMLEQYSATQDSTDYLWYTTTVNLPDDEAPPSTLSLKVSKVQDLLHVFVNGKVANQPPIWNIRGFYQPLGLQAGTNSIELLSVTIGLPSSGPYLETRTGGPRGSVILQGLPSGHLDLTHFTWTHQIGLKGEHLHLESENGSATSTGLWSPGPPPVNEPLVWYKAMVEHLGDETSPAALDLGSMNKGAAWINGHHLGRYWPSQINPSTEKCNQSCDYRGRIKNFSDKCVLRCGQPSQRWYHVPREWMKPTGNVLVLFEEIGGNPYGVSFSRPVVHTVCSHISEYHPRTNLHHSPQLTLDCGAGNTIADIKFASFGNPSGTCGSFAEGACHAYRSQAVAKEACIGHRHCSLRVHREAAGDDPCPERENLSLAVEALCEPDRVLPTDMASH